MSFELIAILVTALLQFAGLVALGVMIQRMSIKQIADDAALYLQGLRLEQATKEVQEMLRKP